MRRLARVAAVLAPLLAACKDLGPEDARLLLLQANEARWETLGPASYVYALERLCFCPVDYRGPARITVEDGVVVERVYVSSGLPVGPDAAEGFPPVDMLFDVLRDAIEREADEIRVTYDPGLGVPVDFWIDYEEMAADEELGMRVTEQVEPLP